MIRLIAIVAFLQFALSGLDRVLPARLMLGLWLAASVVAMASTFRIERYSCEGADARMMRAVVMDEIQADWVHYLRLALAVLSGLGALAAFAWALSD